MIDKPENGATPLDPLDAQFYGEGIPVGLPTFVPKIGAHLHNRRKVNSPQELLDLQELVHFKSSQQAWSIRKDLIGLIRRGSAGEKDESYLDKLRRETKRGKAESSTYGLATIGDHPIVLYAMNWDFFAGSLGGGFG